jgi:phosphomannomutase/phosphoglucomutase
LVRDGAITTALVLEMISYHKQEKLGQNTNCDDKLLDKKSSLSDIFSLFDDTFQYKSSLNLSSNDDMQHILDVCASHGSVYKVEKIDGVKIWFDAESWIMFRPSGTEPLIRIYAESNDKSLLDSKVKEYLNLINKILNAGD